MPTAFLVKRIVGARCELAVCELPDAMCGCRQLCNGRAKPEEPLQSSELPCAIYARKICSHNYGIKPAIHICRHHQCYMHGGYMDYMYASYISVCDRCLKVCSTERLQAIEASESFRQHLRVKCECHAIRCKLFWVASPERPRRSMHAACILGTQKQVGKECTNNNSVHAA